MIVSSHYFNPLILYADERHSNAIWESVFIEIGIRKLDISAASSEGLLKHGRSFCTDNHGNPLSLSSDW